MNSAPTTDAMRHRTTTPARRRFSVLLLLCVASLVAVGAGVWVAAGVARAMAGPTAAALVPSPGRAAVSLRDAADDTRDSDAASD